MSRNPIDAYEKAAGETVDLGNRLADADPEADLWDIGDGLIAGAIQYWLYTREPCGDPECESCGPISTAESRLAELHRLVDELAQGSEYFHSPRDSNAGHA